MEPRTQFVRENRSVPRLAQPPLPAHLAKAASVLGVNPTRIAILHHLALHPDSTIGDLTTSLHLGSPTIHTHLKALEADGVVTADTPAEGRGGRRVRYSSNTCQLRGYLDELLNQIAPASDT